MFYATRFPVAVRRTPYTPSNRVWQHMLDQAARSGHAHPVAVEQDETSTTLRFDVPGITREQLSIGVEGDVVRIESLEGAPRQYKMAYRLPQDIVAETSSAKLENGVLTVKLAKPAPVERNVKIAVH